MTSQSGENRPSLDLFWPRDVVGRVLGEHPFEAVVGDVVCSGCRVVVGDTPQHVMWALRDAVDKLRKTPLGAAVVDERGTEVERDPRESSVVWTGRTEPKGRTA